MFGYVKPKKCELRVREWEHYRATYCGLCHALKRQYGFFARFIINYDFTFLSLVLEAVSSQNNCGKYEYKRCVASPFRKKCACVETAALAYAADASVVLTWWQLCDSIRDKPFFQSVPARFAKLALRRAYHKARKKQAEFDSCVCVSLQSLHEIENENTASLDRPADTFATLLASLSSFCEGEQEARILHEMFYHIGRIIYLTDALADLKEDMEHHTYNPILATFDKKALPLSEKEEERVLSTIYQSVHAAIAAVALLDMGSTHDLIDNILKLGIPSVVCDAKTGAKPKKENKLHERPI